MYYGLKLKSPAEYPNNGQGSENSSFRGKLLIIFFIDFLKIKKIKKI